MMDYSIKWRQEPWLLDLIMSGDPTSDEYAAMIRDQVRYLDGANGRLYWIVDLRDSGPEHGRPLDPGVMAQMMSSPTITHRNGGQIGLVCGSVFMRFVTTMITQSPSHKRSDGVPLRMFNTPEDAEAFCREVAGVDGKLATSCTPTPANV